MRRNRSLRKIAERILAGEEVKGLLPELQLLGIPVGATLAASLVKLVEMSSENEQARSRWAEVLAAFLSSPNPEEAVLNLRRYLENTGGSSSLLDTLVEAPPLLEILAVIFGCSRYLADIVVRNPGLIYWLMEAGTWKEEDDRKSLLANMRGEMEKFATASSKLNCLKRFHRRQLLKIGVLDLLGKRSVDRTAQALSHLAEATVQAVLEVEAAELGSSRGPRGGDRWPTGFAVLALGKLGGRELNYSSDIDLVYICAEDEPEKAVDYTTLAVHLTTGLTDTSNEGYLYRVDLRLRAHGEAGPIVSPAPSLLTYYQIAGKPWEFQAFLKARPIAGDLGLGGEFCRQISSLVFNPSLPYSPLEHVKNTRRRSIEAMKPVDKAANIKLMEGGIRDIEFMVQTLQLVHGPRHKALRTPNTIEAIEKLRSRGFLTPWEARTLREAYRFFRLTEHRLQMMHQIKSHRLPSTPEELELLARRVACGPLRSFPPERFIPTLSSYLNRIRILSESFFAGQEISEESLLLVLSPDDEAAARILARAGITDDARGTLRVIHEMAYGAFPRLLDHRTREVLEKLLPMLLPAAAVSPDPQATLARLSRLAVATGNEFAFYRLLSESGSAREKAILLASVSSLLIADACTFPGALEAVLRDARSVITSSLVKVSHLLAPDVITSNREEVLARLEQSTESLARERSLVRLGAFLVDAASDAHPAEMSRVLTAFARWLFQSLLSSFAASQSFALFALGSFGCNEALPRSDLDVLVVLADRVGFAAGEEAARFLTGLNSILAEAGLFRLDFRLRGEGTNAPIVEDISFYRRYHRERLSPWERIALTKCAFWAGSERVAGQFMELLQQTLSHPFRREDLAALAATRQKTAAKAGRGPRVAWEVKLAPGGTYDIDYIAAVGLSRLSPLPPDTFTLPTAQRIDLLEKAGVLAGEEADLLREAHRFYRLIDYLADLNFLTPPVSEKRSRERAAYMEKALTVLGCKPTRGVLETIAGYRSRVRQVFRGFFPDSP